jgi:hypothetical protein
MSNPFTKSLDPNFRGRYVRVVSNDGQELKGWLERMHHHDRHVVLRDAVDVDRDEELGAAMVAHVDVIEVVDAPSRIERVALEDVEPAPYHARDISVEGNRQYVDQVRDRGFVGSYPVVRPIHCGWEIVEGHKRIWACRQAGLDTHPVEIVDVDEWTAARRFVADHLPDERHVQDDGTTGSGWYGAEAIPSAIDELVGRWGTEALELDRVAFNVDRLDLDVGEDTAAGAGVDDDEEAADDASIEAVETGADAVSIEDLADDITGLGDVGVENLQAAGYETTADLEGATKGALLDVGRVGEKIATQLLAEDAGEDDQGGDEPPETAPDTTICNIEDSAGSDDGTVDQGDASDHEEAEDLNTGDDLSDDQQAFTLEWGHWGPPHSGTYHVDEDCFALGRSDSDREPVPLPQRRDELADDGDWSACGHCSGADDGEESEPDVVDEQSDVESEGDVDVDEPDQKDGAQLTDDTYPRDCHCGATLQNSLELAVHRTEEHGVPQERIGHLEQGEFEAIVQDADDIAEIAEAVSFGIEKTMRMLGVYGLADVVGATDLELSDITDFEFEGVGVDGGSSDDSGGERDERTSPTIDVADLNDPLADDANVDGEGEESGSSADKLSAAEINAAADEHDYLADVADELGVESQKARSLLVSHGRYGDVSEASRYHGGVSQ